MAITFIDPPKPKPVKAKASTKPAKAKADAQPKPAVETGKVSGERFAAWIDAMKAAGLAETRSDCARLLGRRREWVYAALENGIDHATALACGALLKQTEAWK